MNKYYKHAGVVLHKSPKDPVDPIGKDQCIATTAHMAMVRGDYDMLLKCADLLIWRMRWPDDLWHPDGKELMDPYKMTIEPIVMTIIAAYQMNRLQVIDTIRIPIYCWSPHWAAWRMYLLTSKKVYKWIYEATYLMSLTLGLTGSDARSRYLGAFGSWTAKSKRIQKRLRRSVPDWNYCTRQLIEHPLNYLQKDFIEFYLPRDGYLWQEDEKPKDPDYLMGSDEYHPDREVLLYIYEQNKLRA